MTSDEHLARAAGADADVPSPIDWQSVADVEAWAAEAMAKRPWRREFFAAIADALSGADRVLELGSGPGFLAAVVLARHPHVRYTALDVSPVMHDLARQRLAAHASAVTFLTRNLRDPGWTHGIAGFDAVITNQAVHELRHKRHAPALYRGVRDILRVGGTFLMSDHFAGEAGMQNTALYMTPEEQDTALRGAGFLQTTTLIQTGGMVLLQAQA